jgi:hypothetical protein
MSNGSGLLTLTVKEEPSRASILLAFARACVLKNMFRTYTSNTAAMRR